MSTFIHLTFGCFVRMMNSKSNKQELNISFHMLPFSEPSKKANTSFPSRILESGSIDIRLGSEKIEEVGSVVVSQQIEATKISILHSCAILLRDSLHNTLEESSLFLVIHYHHWIYFPLVPKQEYLGLRVA